MCIGCAMTAASAATGFRTWMQTHNIGWLTPKRMRRLTVGAICAATLVSTIGVSGSSAPISASAASTAHHSTAASSR